MMTGVAVTYFLENLRPFAANDPRLPVPAFAVEVRVVRVHVEEQLLRRADAHRVDPDEWRPLLMRHALAARAAVCTPRISVSRRKKRMRPARQIQTLTENPAAQSKQAQSASPETPSL